MNYSLFMLKFSTAVHFGTSGSALSLYTSEDHFCADTLFSAMCSSAVRLYGPEGLDRLVKMARKGSLLISDSMPYCGENLYLPKPYITAEYKGEIDRRKSKAMKKLKWIPVNAFAEFSDSVHGKGEFQAEDYEVKFGESSEVTRARVHEGDDTLPYQIGIYRFHDNCGLYVIIGTESDDDLDYVKKLITAVGISGIGGKISSGCGKYEISDEMYLDEPFDDQTEWLRSALESTSGRSMLITTALPREEELEHTLDDATFMMTRRGGFVQSDTYAEMSLKKDTQYFISSGSVVNRFEGDVYDVGKGGTHPVYRYSKPIFLGVDI